MTDGPPFNFWLSDQTHREDAIGEFARFTFCDLDLPTSWRDDDYYEYLLECLGKTALGEWHDAYRAAWYEYTGDYETSRGILGR